MMEDNHITALHVCPGKPPELVLVVPTEQAFRGLLGANVNNLS